MRYCKKISAALLIMSLTFSCFACGTKEEPTPTDTGITNIEREEEQSEQNEEKEVSEEQVAAADQGSTEEQAEPEKKDEEVAANAVLPKYEYPGPEAFYYFLYGYLIDTLGVNYTDYDVCIPCPVIICEEFEDKQDLKIYGDFWIFNYNLEGETLMNTSGGSYPGCIHIKDDGGKYEVTEIEIVGDGSDFDPTAKKIFGNYYEDFLKASSDTEGREKLRAQIIANYVAANNLKITAYQDYGWDPVTLPEENIDSFYSILD